MDIVSIFQLKGKSQPLIGCGAGIVIASVVIRVVAMLPKRNSLVRIGSMSYSPHHFKRYPRLWRPVP